MWIKKVKIKNYKCFEDFTLDLNKGVNILVGNNESGKSTILEAINLGLTNSLNGKYLQNELNPCLFNLDSVRKYCDELKTSSNCEPELPSITIEIYFDCDGYDEFEGSNNLERRKAKGVSLSIKFDDAYEKEYKEYLRLDREKIVTIPIEYYKIDWKMFSDMKITYRSIPIKSAFIDSSSTRYQNGSDVIISRIISDNLEKDERAKLFFEHRRMKEEFSKNESIKKINEKIKEQIQISDKNPSISLNLQSNNPWQTTLSTYFDEVPFHQIGKGEQCIIKTELALSHKKSEEANLILIEEPENHLTHSKLNKLVSRICEFCPDKQVIITTHSSFVANKLGLENLTLLTNKSTFKFNKLNNDNYNYFKKLPGFQTLRLLLCTKAVLVEGPSDELLFQKAYKDKYGKLPIEDEIDVISVAGLAFKRYLKIAEEIESLVGVIMDNDGKIDEKINNYRDYYDGKYGSIKIFLDATDNDLKTLENQIVDANKNNLDNLCKILDIHKNDLDQNNLTEEIIKKMKGSKTRFALRVFDSERKIIYPDYIMNAVEWCNEEK